MRKYPLVLFLTLSSFLISCDPSKAPDKKESVHHDTLFTLLDFSETGISFSNAIQETLNLNVLMYEYLYNGGGVAVGDLNQDGLDDIYFSSNLEDNHLYLNQGDLKFKEIAKLSGVSGRPGPWKTGVVFVDINGDGKLDIYLCYSGSLPPEKRKNQLFVNQGNDEDGNPIFKEMAEEYGIASSAPSTSAAFFDFDLDGDLDLILLNHNTKSTQNLDVSVTRNLLKEKHEAGPQLFENRNGKFTEITQEAGISSSSLSYGLGLAIADINQDGWPDIYIGNDYTVPDYLYINQGDKTFQDQILTTLDHVSHFSMGNDIADINNDGLVDIFTLDMLPEDNRRQKLLLSPDNFEVFQMNVDKGFHHQYMRNMLHINSGDGSFQEIGQLSGISNTDWSWASLIADFDNDGWKDIFITNGYLRDYNNQDFLKYMDNYVRTAGGQLKREDLLTMVKSMPSSNLTNYIFKNEGSLKFTNNSELWGINHPANSNGAVYADLDNDGDLELIVNNINSKAFIYKNEAVERGLGNFLKIRLEGDTPNTSGHGAIVKAYFGDEVKLVEQNPYRGFQSSISPVLHLGLGSVSEIDSIYVYWLGGNVSTVYGVPSNQTLVFSQKESRKPDTGISKPNLTVTVDKEMLSIPKGRGVNDFKRQPLLTHPISGNGKAMVVEDFNGDGLKDIFVGGDAGISGRIFYQSHSGTFQKVDSVSFQHARESEDADAVAFDANGDGFIDLVVGSGGVHGFNVGEAALEDRLYLSDGKGNFTLSPDAFPGDHNPTGSILAGDFNFDGFQDLFIGNRVVPGQYPLGSGGKLWINDGKGVFKDQTASLAPEISGLGMVTDTGWGDFDQDGRPELIVVGEGTPIYIFSWNGNQWKDVRSHYFDTDQIGLWNTVKLEDWDGDGRVEILVGNLGLNSQLKASEREPMELLYKDFDSNGSMDAILGYYVQGEKYPSASRDEILGQVNFLKKRYLDFKSFSDVRMDDLFTSQEREGARSLFMNNLETAYFVQNSMGKFESKHLPIEAQFSPIFEAEALDINGDGYLDMVLAGNIRYGKLKFGKYDANHGLIMLGDGKGNFKTMGKQDSGLSISGDVRSIQKIDNRLVFLVKEKGILIYGLHSSKSN